MYCITSKLSLLEVIVLLRKDALQRTNTAEREQGQLSNARFNYLVPVTIISAVRMNSFWSDAACNIIAHKFITLMDLTEQLLYKCAFCALL